MKNIVAAPKFFAGAFALLALLAAPSLSVAGPFDGWYDEDTSFNERPAGMQFHQTLFNEYQKLSTDRESAMGDSADAELFNHKALLASTRTAVQNDSVDDRKLNDSDRLMFAKAVDRLHRICDKGGRDLAPVETATAQVSYDCWIEATEGERPQDAADCKKKFDDAAAAAEQKANRELGQVQIAAPKPAPVPVEVPPQEYYMVGFEFDKSQFTAEGEQTLQKAISDVKNLTTLKIALRAHADTSGPSDYNMKLSRRRAEAVLNRMAAAGISQDRLRIVEAVGETRSLIKTGDNVKEPSNRVVEIDMRQ